MIPKNNNNQGVFLELLVAANFLCLKIRSKKKTHKKFFILVLMSKYKFFYVSIFTSKKWDIQII